MAARVGIRRGAQIWAPNKDTHTAWILHLWRLQLGLLDATRSVCCAHRPLTPPAQTFHATATTLSHEDPDDHSVDDADESSSTVLS